MLEQGVGYVCTPLKLPHPRLPANQSARLLVTWTNHRPVSGCRPESLWSAGHKMGGGGRLPLQYSHILLSADKENYSPNLQKWQTQSPPLSRKSR